MNALDARNALFGTRREFPRRSCTHTRARARVHTHVATVYKYASHLSLCSLVVGFTLPESSVFERVHTGARPDRLRLMGEKSNGTAMSFASWNKRMQKKASRPVEGRHS